MGPRQILTKTKFAGVFFLVLALLAPSLAWAMAPAGTVIENQASATVASGERYVSNPVQTVVKPVCVPELASDGTPTHPGQRMSVGAGGYAVFPYVLSNQGNAEFDFQLAWAEAAGSDWHPAEAKLFLDENANGEADPGEPEVDQVRLALGESVRLVLRVKAPVGASGSLWITPVARCPSGETDDQNYAEVRLLSGPALAVEKRFSPAAVLPGEATAVELKVRNLGDAPAGGEVVLSDDLESLSGLAYVSGSAEAPKGTIEYRGPSGWQTSEPSEVRGIRLRLSDLDVGEEAVLRFRLEVAAGHAPGAVENVARAEGPGGPAEARAALEVLPIRVHYLGPGGNPRALPGGEGSADDRQSASIIEGQRYCFDQTLENAGNAEDAYDLDVKGVPAGFQVTLVQPGGAPLPSPVVLPAGSSLDFQVCLRAPAGSAGSPGFELELTATSRATGEANRTWDRVERVYPAGGVALAKTVEPAGPVAAGATLTYTLTAENTYPFDLHDVVVRDPLDEHLEYVESDPAGAYDAARHRVEWRLDRLAAGARWQATLVVRVKEGVPDDTRIANRFSLESREISDPAVSAPVETPVWSTQILLEKEVSRRRVKVGDRVRYTLTLKNPGREAVTLDLADYPDAHLRYLPGSAIPSEPEVEDGRLIWRAVHLAPGEEKSFSYEMRVLPGAPREITNRAIAQGESARGTAVATGWVRARLLSEDPTMLERRGTLVGRVFLDADRDGRFDPGKDTPLPGARVVLADGRQALTDLEGRYAFRGLEPGVWLVGLEPDSAPFPPLPHPAAVGEGYAHRVRVYGLAVSDFPLAEPEGWIRSIRETELRMGPLTLKKRLIPLDEGRYRVVLALSSEQPIPELTVRDPLPGGGEKRFAFDRFVGTRTITYDLNAPAWLTDPEVRWRYP